MDKKNKFQPLVCNDDDVLSFQGVHLFKVCQFKNDFQNSFQTQLNDYISKSSSSIKLQTHLHNILLSINIPSKLGFKAENMKIQWSSINEGIDCELLRMGATNWEKGKLRIHVTIEIRPQGAETEKTSISDISLEFCPDEPEPQETPQINQSESPLADLRQKLNEITL
ncbi:MAG: KGK domain-containing protein [Nostocaceae cyanobacterium]|nr:KGK domain-containing protein [Nostocaceae cyanobacterium]